MPIIPAFGRLRQEVHKFQANLGYRVCQPPTHQKKKKKNQTKILPIVLETLSKNETKQKNPHKKG
jgi:hypothetical protein